MTHLPAAVSRKVPGGHWQPGRHSSQGSLGSPHTVSQAHLLNCCPTNGHGIGDGGGDGGSGDGDGGVGDGGGDGGSGDGDGGAGDGGAGDGDGGAGDGGGDGGDGDGVGSSVNRGTLAVTINHREDTYQGTSQHTSLPSYRGWFQVGTHSQAHSHAHMASYPPHHTLTDTHTHCTQNRQYLSSLQLVSAKLQKEDRQYSTFPR